jgi:hypothetical protein
VLSNGSSAILRGPEKASKACSGDEVPDMLRAIKRKIKESILSVPPVMKVFESVARTGVGSNECLRHGFLPVPVSYYSPIPDIEDLIRRNLWDKKSEMPGIDFRIGEQLSLLEDLGEKFGKECVWPLEKTRDDRQFHVDNSSFSFGCAASTRSFIRNYKPKRIFEVGSGMSSRVISEAVMMNRSETGIPAEYVIVDPYPGEVIRNGLRGLDRLVESRVELLPPSFFDSLTEGDILFIDSSHTVKIGSDCNYLYLEIIPSIRPGVILHIHDIALPYEYPRTYATSETFRQFWTEQYILQAFLSHNRNFEVMLAMYYIMNEHLDVFGKSYPGYDREKHKLSSGSFWIRRKPTN